MTDVFISYKSESRPVARRLADELGLQGFDVWFDDAIYAGDHWAERIYEELGKAKVVVVLWSPKALASPWVKKEAAFAFEGDKYVPAFAELCQLPDAYAHVQAANLAGWNGQASHPEFEALLHGIGRICQPSMADQARPGFVTDFLVAEVSLPAVTGRVKEYRYRHFSIVMNPHRSLAWYGAYNITSEQQKVDRRAMRWRPDPLLDAAYQPKDEQFRQRRWDRGHLVSPATVSWGDVETARMAANQANYWTNVTPQDARLNRRDWLSIEVWERNVAAERERAIGFSGPVFGSDDIVGAPIDTSDGRVKASIESRIPRQYWKVVVAPGQGTALEARAFIVEQGDADAAPAPRGAQHGNPESFVVEINALEALTGLQFPDVVRKASPIAM